MIASTAAAGEVAATRNQDCECIIAPRYGDDCNVTNSSCLENFMIVKFANPDNYRNRRNYATD